MKLKKNTLLILSLTLISGLAISQQNAKVADKSSSPTPVTPVVNLEKIKEDQLKFTKENAKLNLENLERMRDSSIKNTNAFFEKSIANQKVLDKLSIDAIEKNTTGTVVLDKSRELQKEQEKFQTEMNNKMQAENIKFQQMMQNRQMEMSGKNAAKSNPVPKAN